ncbi:XRE family transcriptional regulator [Limnobaculum zhutongyuii]|uniref:XRE family transcriptional regulator n=1 Tax=Limnobaculum zhutongyuii TaxID=2498113 RepID=A0A411WGX3_9GAMM|nr:helix-turn-helix transcriptional regulator [Limnobaculum zhutongyuii]QBH95495.1 XRE family transcriptional regulator [Limnobaculum zhutongyuii]TQS88816.1 XRE family transcriptional regulator [Limnobaculum zhutongyuii]
MSYEPKELVTPKGINVPIKADEIGTSFSTRLKELIGPKQSIRAFAKDVGISYGGLHKYLTGATLPTLDNLLSLVKYTGVSIEWLATGEGPKFKDDSGVTSEFAFIPRYNVSAAAGDGAWNETEEPSFLMAFRKYWIEQYLRADPKQLSVISVQGYSMEGILNDKDVILINHADVDAKEGIYVLRIDGHLFVKLVQRLPGEILKFSSANSAYESFTVDLNNPPNDFCIIGKVVWYGRNL